MLKNGIAIALQTSTLLLVGQRESFLPELCLDQSCSADLSDLIELLHLYLHLFPQTSHILLLELPSSFTRLSLNLSQRGHQVRPLSLHSFQLNPLYSNVTLSSSNYRSKTRTILAASQLMHSKHALFQWLYWEMLLLTLEALIVCL